MESKLYAIIGRVGIMETAKQLGMSYPTLKKRLDNNEMGEFKSSEVKLIELKHKELFPCE